MWNNHVPLIHVIVNRTNIKYVQVEWNCQRLYIWECKSRNKDKMLGKIVGIKERTKRDLGKFSLTLLKGQYV
jgi:hypothetical protein